MGIVISYGLQKGGVGKTTATAISAHILAERGFKVLAVDFDSQGNLTQFLTQQSPYAFVHKTSFEACKDRNPEPYIHHVNDNLHLLPAEDFLSGFDRWVYTQVPASEQMTVLQKTLDVVKSKYDLIFLDLPPNLGGQTLNGISASDYCVVVMQSEPFSFDAIERYLEVIQAVQDRVNDNTRLAGILTSLLDSRTSLGNYIMQKVQSEYGEFVFNTVIRRKSRVTEFSFEGLQNKSKADKEAFSMYEEYVEELLQRVGIKDREI